ncbi:AAA family ATPase [Pseudomonas shahriarae]|uniref:AAA family ATPase n=1 Tax=Pseudomonas shahriarae TaxID=2745512 RepID=UPI00249A96EE|nr:AAA family ATPase [Pseudomonas shahriarae]MDI3206660.1 AAA family ATPase [Pseudomonas shahriarae]
MGLQKRIGDLVASVSAGMFEREEIIAVSLLGALCGQNTFLYGPPGTAKSLISRRIACAFEQPTYFEYLMNRFSTPEEVFGPVSIKALKEDNYIRKTDNYLPKAEFAFLDEIWKSSPAILNTLLTLINEHVFRNGEVIEKAPLKALIAASNETPDANQGLEALYDRFIVRLLVGPIREAQHFDQLVNSKPTEAKIDIPLAVRVKSSEWAEWMAQSHQVKLSAETLTIIHLIRERLEQQYETLKVYVSDRRWQRAAMLIKAAAFFNDRRETNHSDALLLQHCLWTHEENRQTVWDIVAEAVKICGFDSGIDLAALDKEKDSLDKEIKKELFHSADIYKTVSISNKGFFQCKGTFKPKSNYYSNREKTFEIFIAKDRLKTKDEFHPVDSKGNEQKSIKCKFDGQGTCQLNMSDGHMDYVGIKFTPEIIFHKGDKKEDINIRLVTSLSYSVSEIRDKLSTTLKRVEKRFKSYEAKLNSPFVPADKVSLAISGIALQIEGLQLRIKDCERLEELCR